MAIELRDICYTYLPGTPYERQALQHISLTIPEGSITAIAGHTGSGKSTLVQHLSGLLHPTSGQVLVDGVDITDRAKKQRQQVKRACQSVGMVFQYAEQQLFEETVAKDIAFGPERQGLTGEALQKRVAGAMQLVHLDEALSARSPFQLSGGQQRRVAIAGILALQPRYLVLDEPTAGLDPCGRAQLMQLLRELHKKQRMTLVLITHNMDDIAELADQLIILHQGVFLAVGEPRELFQQRELLQQAGLQPPQVVQVLDVLRAHGLSVPETAMTLQEAVKAVQQAVKKHKGGKKC